MTKIVTFEHEGMDIHNPFLSSCGRFTEKPSYYGFYEIDTSGNCKALRKDIGSNQHILLTDLSGSNIPASWGDALIGLYELTGFQIEPNEIIPAHRISFSADGDDDEPGNPLIMSDKEKDSLVERAMDAAVNAGCLLIQQAIGQTDGGPAGICFSDSHDEFTRVTSEKFMNYLNYEIHLRTFS